MKLILLTICLVLMTLLFFKTTKTIVPNKEENRPDFFYEDDTVRCYGLYGMNGNVALSCVNKEE